MIVLQFGIKGFSLIKKKSLVGHNEYPIYSIDVGFVTVFFLPHKASTQFRVQLDYCLGKDNGLIENYHTVKRYIKDKETEIEDRSHKYYEEEITRKSNTIKELTDKLSSTQVINYALKKTISCFEEIK